MKRCKAFYPIAGSRTAWIPCVQKAEGESGFCRRHGDAIIGAWLGAVVHDESSDEAALERRSGRVERKKDKARRNDQREGKRNQDPGTFRAWGTRHLREEGRAVSVQAEKVMGNREGSR